MRVACVCSPEDTVRYAAGERAFARLLAFCSCASLPWGFFNAYGHIAERDDLDAVLHLGDYLYEHANGGFGDGTEIGRVPRPDREIVSLADYRTRHAQYKADADARAVFRGLQRQRNLDRRRAGRVHPHGAGLRSRPVRDVRRCWGRRCHHR